jgi:hypothetical protein
MVTALAAASVVVALVALAAVGSLQRKLKTLSQSHWELHFEFARLRARVAKLDGGPTGAAPADEPGA